MDVNSLEIGATYFRISYADVAQTMPSIEPLVYVGVNIFESPADGTVKYYFQDAVSVVRFGLGVQSRQEVQPDLGNSDQNSKNDEGRVYSTHEAGDIGEVIVDLPALAAEIDSAIKRAEDLGYPKLSRAKGNWV